MTQKEFKKAPMVSNLEHLKSIIKNLEFTSIPLSGIDERLLLDAKDKGALSEENYESVNDWIRTELGFKNTKGYLQSIVSLLKNLNIVENVVIEKDELEKPLGLSGPIISSFFKKKLTGVHLTNSGYKLCELLNQGDNFSMKKYYDLLFWSFLTSSMVNNFQRLIEDKDSYNIGIDECLRKYEEDQKSITMFKIWTNYFELTRIGSDKLIPKEIVKKIVMATIFEINLLENNVYSIQKLVSRISQRLGFSSNLINFPLIIKMVLSDVHSSNEKSKAIEGSYASRVTMTLPDSDISMLKIKKKIEAVVDWKKIPDQMFANILRGLN